MGRELRRVPKDWVHPKRDDGRYQPMFDEPHSKALAEWTAAKDAFAKGLREDGTPLPLSASGYTFEEWHGERPNEDYYRPDWKDEERTHFQMYEDTTEGTPKSPVLDTPEECARWCADNNVSAFGHEPAPYEWWLKVCEGTAGFGLMVEMPSGAQSLA